MQRKSQSKAKTSKQYEDLGRIVASVYETGFLDAAKSYKSSFIKGLFQGFGGVVGATIVVAILIWIMSLFSQVPLLGRLAENLRDTVQTGQQK